MAALADGPATTDELCARIGRLVDSNAMINGVGTVKTRPTVAAGLEDILDDLSLAQAIGGRHIFDDGETPPVVQWVRLLPCAAPIHE